MSFLDYGIGSHTCGGDLIKARRVEVNSSDNIVYAPATRLGVGITRLDQVAGEEVGVAYFNKPGTSEMEAAGEITVGAAVYAAASGKIQALPTAAGDYVKVGVALEAAAEDGDIIEVLPVECGKVATVS